MKIGIISDIYGDLTPLKRALRILGREKVNRIVCAGDVVERGSNGDAVVQILQKLKIPTVKGNHDVAAISNQAWLRENGDPNHPRTQSQLLTDSTLDYLATLPEKVQATREGKSFYVAHGSPWDNWTYITMQSSKTQLETVVRFAKTDYVILGHTHEVMSIYVDGRWILNPGSVCYDETPGSGTCATLSLPDGTFKVFDLRNGHEVQIPHQSYD